MQKQKITIQKVLNGLIIFSASIVILTLITAAFNKSFMLKLLNANTGTQDYVLGTITKTKETTVTNYEGEESPGLSAQVKILNQNKTVSIETDSASRAFYDIQSNSFIIETGDDVILLASAQESGVEYFLHDTYRLDAVVITLVIFVMLAVIFAGVKGFASFLGLIISLLTLTAYVVPSILAGQNPIVVSLIGSGIIGILSLYLAHGINRRTSIALASTFISIIIAVIFATLFVNIAKLMGIGSEEALYVSGLVGSINLKGLLLGGIIIGTLGVLDDITTAQTAVVEELKITDTTLNFKELYKRATSVGREHIASLINTLVLAYAGSSFPLFILIVGNITQPLWITLNSEFIVEEVIRTIVGSSTLILAVPITTALAAYHYSKLDTKTIRNIKNAE